MNDRFPQYSVLMSVYTKEKPEYLKYSVQSMLDQTVPADEFVLVEDGPLSDELTSVIEDFVKNNPDLFHIVLLPKNVGLGLALARGIQECRNEFIARMDSDDYSDPRRCEKELCCFINNPDLNVVGCYEAEFQDTITNISSVHKVPEATDAINTFMHRRCAILHPTVIYRKNAVLSCGNYHNVPLFEDYDLFIRMVRNHSKCCNLQEALYFIRIGDDFFKRRGGLRYMKTAVTFKRKQYQEGYFSLLDYLASAGGQAAACLLPNRLRKAFYLTFLRK